ncbi:PCRF domain-containing protein, partial [Escherichia coli]|uniref:PCRF domain-containing protein n=1 Tax=Escherichia coli TaxID=562 RepID=UPI003B9ED47B
EPVVEAFTAFVRGEEDLATAQEMLADPELKAMAEEEIKSGRVKLESLEAALQLLLLPAATLASGLAALFPQGQFVPHADNAWLRVHLLIALGAYGLITIAALHAMLMALLDRHLHRPLDAPAER